MACSCSFSGVAQRSLVERRAGARRSAGRQRVAVRAGLLDTLIKPITSSGEVSRACRWVGGLPQAAGSGSLRLPTVPPPPVTALILPPSRLQRKPLKEGIANFYDESSQLWESIWVCIAGWQPTQRLLTYACGRDSTRLLLRRAATVTCPLCFSQAPPISTSAILPPPAGRAHAPWVLPPRRRRRPQDQPAGAGGHD
jgi:hypothetical protein